MAEPTPNPQPPAPAGIVSLVGAGPGDPGLLTVRAAELLRSTDCCIYDYLVNPAILALLPNGCEQRYVGKRGGDLSARFDADIAHVGLRIWTRKSGDDSDRIHRI